MSEEEQSKIQPQVELDTDDVNEQSVEVENKEEESKEPNLNYGEVDLGYTLHDEEERKKKEQESSEEDKTYENERETKLEKKDNLGEFSEGIQKRIDKLTAKYREAERREQAALEYAKGLQKKYEGMSAKYDSGEEQYLKELDARVDAQRDDVKRQLRDAIANGDADQIAEYNEKLTQLSVEKEKARYKLQEREQRLKAAKEEAENQPQEQQQSFEQQERPEPSDKAKSWASQNSWFGNDKIMTNAAYTIHEELVAMGIDAESDEYYNEIDKRMKDNFPHKFGNVSNTTEQRRPVQTVASAGRKQSGRRTVKLTKSQVAIAKKLGVPLEEYAKFVKEV